MVQESNQEGSPGQLDLALDRELRELNARCPYHRFLPLDLESCEPGVVWLQTTVQEQHLNPENIVHGGVLASLADTAMGMALRTQNRHPVTIEFNLSFLQPGRPQDTLRARGTVLQMGGRNAVAEARVYSQDGIILAVARGVFALKGKVVAEDGKDQGGT